MLPGVREHPACRWRQESRARGRHGNMADTRFAVVHELRQYWLRRSVDDGLVHSKPVAGYMDNCIGLFNMAAGVWQWCANRPDTHAHNERNHGGKGFDWGLPYLGPEHGRVPKDFDVANIDHTFHS